MHIYLQAEELVQSETLRCYEENTLLAVELKTLVMGSLGADVPDSFEQESAVDASLSEYRDYFTDAVKDSILSEIASDNVRKVLENGMSGALNAYRFGGGLTDILDSATDSVVDGVAASIQDAPEQYALDVLDQTTGGLASVAVAFLQGESVQEALGGTGGLVGEITDILEYDATPEAFFRELSESVNESSQEVAEFLQKDSITSNDIGKMMYEYTQFGSSLLNPMEEYRNQIEQLDYDCNAVQNYAVRNFQVQYDMEGSEWIQGDNQFNYAVEKLAKYIPGGLFFSMMAAGAIDNNDQYYENMIQTSDAISEGRKI